MKYLILGNGFIGNFLRNTLSDSQLDTDRIENDLDVLKINDVLDENTIVINCIGKTGRPNVDWCESHKEETYFSNVKVPKMLAYNLDKPWVHIGSGCVYTGYEKAWSEVDEPNFEGSYYSQTKKESQEFLDTLNNVLILRIRMPISPDINEERNYVAKIRKYVKEGRSLFDMQNSMTYLPDLTRTIEHLTNIKAIGTYNVVNPKSLSPVDVATRCHERLGDPLPNVVSYDEIRKTICCDRSNCLLSCKKLRKTGFQLNSIKRVMDQLIK